MISSAELQLTDCVVNLRPVFSSPNSTYLVGVWCSHVTNIPTRKTCLYFCWLRGVVVVDDVTLPRRGRSYPIGLRASRPCATLRCAGDSRQPMSRNLALRNFPFRAWRLGEQAVAWTMGPGRPFLLSNREITGQRSSVNFNCG